MFGIFLWKFFYSLVNSTFDIVIWQMKLLCDVDIRVFATSDPFMKD